VEKHGTKAWAKIAGLIRTKGSKQCRRRWKNSLNMSAKTCSWSAEVGRLGPGAGLAAWLMVQGAGEVAPQL
jgi:hypothetical protein